MEMIFTILCAVGITAFVFGCRALAMPLLTRWYMRKFESDSSYYHTVLLRYLPYYRLLSPDLQEKFLRRTYLFSKWHKFHYVEISEKREMPVLISAMAVQLTLGLNQYLFRFFRNIYVLQHDYQYGYYSMPFMGHVDHSGIYLTWENVLKGIEEGMRGRSNANLGLHEMAHALTYVNFVSASEEDRHFKKEFTQFSAVARPIFNDMQVGVSNVLGAYAATNYNEFWAVSVEVFFSNPVQLQKELPDLYDALKRLLRQDPLMPGPLFTSLN